MPLRVVELKSFGSSFLAVEAGGRSAPRMKNAISLLTLVLVVGCSAAESFSPPGGAGFEEGDAGSCPDLLITDGLVLCDLCGCPGDECGLRGGPRGVCGGDLSCPIACPLRP